MNSCRLFAAALVLFCGCYVEGCGKGQPDEEDIINQEIEALRKTIESEVKSQPPPGSCSAYFLAVKQRALRQLEEDPSLDKPHFLGALIVLPAKPKPGDTGYMVLEYLERETWCMGMLAWRSTLTSEPGWLLPLFAHDPWLSSFEVERNNTVFLGRYVDVMVVESDTIGLTVPFAPTGEVSSEPTVLLPVCFVGENLKFRLYDQQSQFSNTLQPTWMAKEEVAEE